MLQKRRKNSAKLENSIYKNIEKYSAKLKSSVKTTNNNTINNTQTNHFKLKVSFSIPLLN